MKASRLDQAVHRGDQRPSPTRPGGAAARPRGPRPLNVLVVALDALPPAVPTGVNVLVVAPALNSRLRHWFSDEDAARLRAKERVAAVVERLERSGAHAQGRVGDADPLLAIADALRTFPADEIVVAGGLEQSSRLAERLTSRARRRFALPVRRTPDPRPLTPCEPLGATRAAFP
jgi:hypothetical protein